MIRNIRTLSLSLLLCCCALTVAAAGAAGQSQKQARTAIATMAGSKLPNNAVRVKNISATDANSAEVSADVKTILKFTKDKAGSWRIAEIRTAQDQWEDVDLIAAALKIETPYSLCNTPDPPLMGRVATDPSMKRARCLLGSLLGVEIPSAAVRIQDVEPMAIPFASQPSATVVAWLRIETRLSKASGSWRVTELRAGNRNWVQLELLTAALNEQKQARARAELDLMARALERFRRERGYYVVSDSHAVAIDHLNPRYMPQIIRVDPWHQPYKYLGERDHYVLRSTGPDGKPSTADDIEITHSSR